MRNFIKDYLKDTTEICPQRLNKKIREVTIISRNPITEKEALLSKIIFDFDCNKIEEKKYCLDKVITWIKYIYSDNKLFEIREGNRDWNNGSNNESDFLFSSTSVKLKEEKGIVTVNEKGQKIISTFWLTGELASQKKLNEKDICIESVEFARNGGITNRVIYDANGQMMEARRYKSDGTRLNYTFNYFDARQKLYRSDSVSRTGYPTHVTVLKYDNRGLLVETIEHPANPDYAFADEKGGYSGHGYKYFYTHEGLLEMKNHYQGGKHMGSHLFTYEYW